MTNEILQSFLDDQLASFKKRGLFNNQTTKTGANGPIIEIDGKKLINLCSNNYLSFANDERLKEAAINSIKMNGVGAGGGRILNGTTTVHIELEKILAEFKNTEAALTFPSGYNSNTTVIPALLDNNDIVLSDELNHISVVESVKLSEAKMISYRHSDMVDLTKKVEDIINNQQFNKIMIITSGVFSMDGDIAKLPEIVEIAEKYNLITYVDDAHGSGVLGGGAGTVKHFGLEDVIDIQMGTLSKALGVIGGYVAGKKELIEWLRMSSDFFRYSTAMPPAMASACIKAVEILKNDSSVVNTLWERKDYFCDHLGKLGFDTGNSESGIIPCIFGDEIKTQKFSEKLYHLGVYVNPLVYPAVPLGKGRLRNIVTVAHTKEMIDKALIAYETVGKEMGVI